jgi:hypothetical protein
VVLLRTSRWRLHSHRALSRALETGLTCAAALGRIAYMLATDHAHLGIRVAISPGRGQEPTREDRVFEPRVQLERYGPI